MLQKMQQATVKAAGRLKPHKPAKPDSAPQAAVRKGRSKIKAAPWSRSAPVRQTRQTRGTGKAKAQAAEKSRRQPARRSKAQQDNIIDDDEGGMHMLLAAAAAQEDLEVSHRWQQHHTKV